MNSRRSAFKSLLGFAAAAVIPSVSSADDCSLEEVGMACVRRHLLYKKTDENVLSRMSGNTVYGEKEDRDRWLSACYNERRVLKKYLGE